MPLSGTHNQTNSRLSRSLLGKHAGSHDEMLPAAAGKERENGGERSRFSRKRAGGAGAGGRVLRQVRRQIIRGVTNPRFMFFVGLLFFMASAAGLYFFGRVAHCQEDEQRRLTEPQRLTPDLPAAVVVVPERLQPELNQPAPPTVPPWKAPVLPPEVFREVPPELCSPSKLTEKIVDPSDYEFGCDEIEVRQIVHKVKSME